LDYGVTISKLYLLLPLTITVHDYMAFSIVASLSLSIKYETQNDPPLTELHSMEQRAEDLDILDGENKRPQTRQHDQGAMASWAR
jgi:hypothetical protein